MRWGVGLLFAWVLSAQTTLYSLASPISYQPCILTYCPPRFSVFPPRSFTSPPTNPLKTNAQRLARGVALIPPKTRPTKTGPFKRIESSLRPSPSPVPRVHHCGIISVKDKGGNCVGYVDKKTYHSGQLFITQDKSQAAKVKFRSRSHQSHIGNASVWLTDWSESDKFPLLGLVLGSDDTMTPISPVTSGQLLFAGIEYPGSGPGEVPTYLNNSYSASTGNKRAAESRVWTIDLETGLMQPEWINSDKSKPSIQVFGSAGALYASADPELWATDKSIDVTLYTLYFIKIQNELGTTDS